MAKNEPGLKNTRPFPSKKAKAIEIILHFDCFDFFVKF